MTNTERDHLREAVPVAWACRHETAGDELEWHHPTIPALTKDDIENGWTMEPLFSAAALASKPALDPATVPDVLPGHWDTPSGAAVVAALNTRATDTALVEDLMSAPYEWHGPFGKEKHRIIPPTMFDRILAALKGEG